MHVLVVMNFNFQRFAPIMVQSGKWHTTRPIFAKFCTCFCRYVHTSTRLTARVIKVEKKCTIKDLHSINWEYLRINFIFYIFWILRYSPLVIKCTRSFLCTFFYLINLSVRRVLRSPSNANIIMKCVTFWQLLQGVPFQCESGFLTGFFSWFLNILFLISS